MQEACVIREVRHPDWLANPVIVPKKGGKERMCVDFKSLNKSFPQDANQVERLPREYIFVGPQEANQCLLLGWGEVGTYGEGGA